MPTEPSKPAFNIVFVCTGNRFRSPLAAALMEKLAEGLPVVVTSMGTLDLGSLGPLPEAGALASGYGVSLNSHRTRPIRRGSLVDADLVVGFERVHIVTAVIDGGAKAERAFTLPDLVDLLEQGVRPDPTLDPAQRARQAVASAHDGRVGARREAMLEIADPLGQPWSTQEEIARRLSDLTQRLASALFGSSS